MAQKVSDKETTRALPDHDRLSRVPEEDEALLRQLLEAVEGYDRDADRELITRAFFRYWEDVHYQFRQGLYDEVEFSRQRDAWQAYAGESAALVTWWCRNRSQFSPEFAAEFDGILTRHTCA